LIKCISSRIALLSPFRGLGWKKEKTDYFICS
jgi:hypothetical protein